MRTWLQLRWLGVAVLLLASRAALASEPLALQQLEHSTWDLTKGSPLNLIDITEDTHGVLWLTSPSGLYTFDGQSFKQFDLPPNIDAASSLVFTVSRALRGNLWGASRTRGLIRIDPQHRITVFGPTSGLPGHPATGVREDPSGNAWAIADGRLYHLLAGRWEDETAERALPLTPLTADLVDAKGTLWVASRSGLFSKRLGEERFQKAVVQWQAGETPTQLIEGPRSTVWVSLHRPDQSGTLISEANLTGQDLPSRRAVALSYSSVDAVFDSSGTLWVSGQGIDRITFPTIDHTESAEALKSEPVIEHLGAKEGISSDATRAILVDNQQDVWVATMRGLERFRAPVLIKASSPQIDSSTVADLAAGKDGTVLLGGKNVPLYQAKGNVSSILGPAVDSFYCLFQDSKGDIWFNSQKGLWHKQGENLLAMPLPDGVNYGRLRQVVELLDHSLLFSFYDRGVWRWSEEHWARTTMGTSYGENPTVLFVNKSGALWAGYPSGRITTGNGVTEHVISGSESQVGTIQGFYEHPSALLASGQRGILALLNGRFQPLRFANEALATNVSGIVQSQNGDLWLNGQHGVARVSDAELQWAIRTSGEHLIEGRIFTQTDIQGPAPFFYDLPTAAKDSTGTLWFNTSGSLVHLNPQQVAGHSPLPIVSVGDILIDGRKLDTDAAIPPRPQTIRIAFFGSNLSSPEQVRYRYKLAGVDHSWQYVGDRTEAVYTHLKPGEYTFEVAATSGEGIWTDPLATQFFIQPAFYETTTFRLFCVACFAGSLVLLYRWRVRYILTRFQERAEERAEERVRIARDLHDTLLQGFQGLILKFHLVALRLPERSTSRDEMDLALDRAEKIMAEGRDRVSLLRSDDLRGISLRDALLAFCAQSMRDGGPTYSVENLTPELELRGAIKDELYWIAREALSNAFRHAEASHITVQMIYGPRHLQLFCIDNGRGIDDEVLESGEKAGHYGLPGTRERARRVNAEIRYHSSRTQGTRVEVSVPAGFAFEKQQTMLDRLNTNLSRRLEQ